MNTSKNHISQRRESFEHTVYRSSVVIAFIIIALLISLKYFYPNHNFSSTSEVVGLVALAVFYITSWFTKSRLQHVLFIAIFFILIDIAWLYDGGSNIINILLYLLISIYSIVLVTPILRRPLLIFIMTNIIALTTIEMFGDLQLLYMDNNYDYYFAFRTILLIAIISLLLAMTYFNRSYSRDRQYLISKNNELINLNVKVQEINNMLNKHNEKLDLITKKIENDVKSLEEKNMQINNAKRNLEKLVERRTGQLMQKNQELDLLFYRSSHDFRRPLASLLGLTEFANIVCNSESKTILSLVGQTAREMDNMFRKFYNLYRINHIEGKHQISSIAEIFDSIKEKVAKAQCELVITNSISDIEAKDKSNFLLNIILHCLVENALNYRKFNEPGKIEITASESLDLFTFRVKDYGQGIPATYHDKIFDMYFRANLASKGNGLGLYVVRKAIDKLGGQIELNSEENEFTEFILKYHRIPCIN